MIVIKIGGSLTDSPLLKDWLAYAADFSDGKIVIVPGGGNFAEQVRAAQKQWRFSDETAHLMALLAMQQMALQFQGIIRKLCVAATDQEIHHVLQTQNAVIWSPCCQWLAQSGVEASWNITSDSLAAWLAAELSANQLILVKSVDIKGDLNFQQLSDMGIVDKAFNRFIAEAKFSVKLYNRNDITLFNSELRTDNLR